GVEEGIDIVLLADVEHLVLERPRHPRGEHRRLGERLRAPPAADHGRPQALTGPLAGGSAGAHVAVEPLIAGHLDFPRAAMVDPGGSFKTLRIARAISSSKQAQTVPAPAFLIHHPTVGPVLVDTGLHPSIATDGGENFGGIANRFGRPSL